MSSTGMTGPFRTGVSMVLAASLLAGCATGNTVPPANLAADAGLALERGNTARSIRLAEQAVQAEPRNGEFRALLGTAYLRAGRFASARQAFAEAIELGQSNGKIALSLALSEMTLGRSAPALDTLSTYRDVIPASDMGLALALAGDTAHGIMILTNALRQGEDSAKLRQNLAFAYALDGRWVQARVMAAQDVPAADLDKRMAEWALAAKPGALQSRVASLLKVPVVARDAGLPAALALANAPTPDQLGAEAEAAQAKVAVAADGELPATEDAAVMQLAAYSPQPASTPTPAPALPVPAAKPAPAIVAPKRSIAAARPVPAAPKMQQAPVPPYAAQTGTHVVQLGSFASAEGARRAWQHYSARTPQLQGYRNVTTQVIVNGKQYWRLQAAGFASGPAHAMCSTVKARGGACLVLAAPKGSVPGASAPDMRMARRR